MKWILRSLLGLIIVIALVLITGPWLIGRGIERQIEALLDQAERDPFARVIPDPPRRGWFRTETDSLIRVTEDAEGIALPFLHRIDHGPICWSREPTFAWASIHSTLLLHEMSGSAAELAQALWPFKSLEIESYFRFKKFQHHVLTVQPTRSEQIDIGQARAKIEVDGGSAPLVAIDGSVAQLKLKRVSAPQPLGEVNFQLDQIQITGGILRKNQTDGISEASFTLDADRLQLLSREGLPLSVIHQPRLSTRLARDGQIARLTSDVTLALRAGLPREDHSRPANIFMTLPATTVDAVTATSSPEDSLRSRFLESLFEDAETPITIGVDIQWLQSDLVLRIDGPSGQEIRSADDYLDLARITDLSLTGKIDPISEIALRLRYPELLEYLAEEGYLQRKLPGVLKLDLQLKSGSLTSHGEPLDLIELYEPILMQEIPWDLLP
ncbi:MAG: DUF945 family protein [Verrucomicrobiota bacterium]